MAHTYLTAVDFKVGKPSAVVKTWKCGNKSYGINLQNTKDLCSVSINRVSDYSLNVLLLLDVIPYKMRQKGSKVSNSESKGLREKESWYLDLSLY